MLRSPQPSPQFARGNNFSVDKTLTLLTNFASGSVTPELAIDNNLAELGRKAIRDCRNQNVWPDDGTAGKVPYGKSQPPTGARIAGCLHMAIQTATLQALEAEVT